MKRSGARIITAIAKTGRVGVFLIRLIVGGIVLFVILFVLLGVVKGCTPGDKPPTITEAPWAVQTSSLYYYAKEFSLQGDVPSIKDYWIFDGKRYHFQTGVLSFPPELYGKIAIIKRTGEGVEP